MDLRDFESIPGFFSEEEMEKLQAAIDERRRRRLALEDRSSEQADHSPNVVEAVFSALRIEHPA